MNAFWDQYWPAIMAALVIGVGAGVIAFRSPARSKRQAVVLATAAAAVLLVAGLLHGPFGAGARFAQGAVSQARQTLDYYEMTQVQVRLESSPLRRTLVLSGPADDFQRSELVRILDEVPGIQNVRWSNVRPRPMLPLLAEAELAALAGFGLGLVLAYLLELRRRSRAQWSW